MERLGKAWRHGGLRQSDVWLENGCLGAGKLVSARPRPRAGESTIFVKHSAAVQARALFLRPGKLDLGRSGRRLGGLVARLDGHLGGPRVGLDANLGPLGRPGRRSGVDSGGIWGSQTGPKEQFSGSEVEKCKIAKSSIFHRFLDDFGGLGAREIDQNGVRWLSKSVRDGWWTQNMHLGG